MSHLTTRDYEYDARSEELAYENLPADLARLEDLDDYHVAEQSGDPRGWDVVGRRDEKLGTVESLLVSPTTGRAYFAIVDTGGWFESRRFAVPLRHVGMNELEKRLYVPYTEDQFRGAPEYDQDSRDFGGYYRYWNGVSAGSAMDFDRDGPAFEGELHVPLTEETAEVRKQRRRAGFITVQKRVETRHISEPVSRTRVTAETRAVPAGEEYRPDERVSTLRAGETLRVPVTEEELEVRKTPRVTQEVVLRAEPETEQVERDVELRRERVDVDTEGDVEIETTDPATPGRRW
jgi:uncharacterized protein (TIGR02271 family)